MSCGDCCNCCGDVACPFPRWKFYFECPDNGSCNCCSTDWTLVISGVTGGGGNCSILNGTFTLVPFEPGPCIWTSGTDTTPSNIWLMSWNGTFWEVRSVDSLIVFSAGSDVCPTAGSLSLISNSCTGSPTATLTANSPIADCPCEYIITLTGDAGGISVSGGVATSLVDQNITGTITTSPSTAPCTDTFCVIFVRINGDISPQPVLAGGAIIVTVDLESGCTQCNEVGPVCEQSMFSRISNINGTIKITLNKAEIINRINKAKRIKIAERMKKLR